MIRQTERFQAEDKKNVRWLTYKESLIFIYVLFKL